jgi:hypothetical protein
MSVLTLYLAGLIGTGRDQVAFIDHIFQREVCMSSLGNGQKAADTPAEGRTDSQPESAPTPNDRNDRIREIAYFLWLEEGSPDGEADRHWSTAETLLESEPEQRKRIEGEPPGEPVSESRTPPRPRRTAAE